ncbi:MAG: tetratricopeptide repeat protein [Nitrospirae bacterium]|nr:tetratricopeptide repeat protein [Nitrospirota bacterium]
MPKVSVIIPSYNHETFVAEAIQSVLDQTFQDFEIVITDDGSTDGTVNEIKKFRDPRIRLFIFEKNQGACVSANKCVTEAKGEYIAMLSSDDLFLPDKLEKQVKFLDENPDISAVFGQARIINEKGNDFSNKSHFYCSIFNQPNRSRFEWLNVFFYKGNCLCHPSVLIRNKCYREIGMYNERLVQLPDFEFWVRICLKYEIYVMPECLIKFRVRDGELNASGNRPEVHIRSVFEFEKALRLFLIITKEDYDKIFPDAIKDPEICDDDLVPFLTALRALDVKNNPVYFRFALDTIYSLLGEEKIARKIKEKYNFGYKDLVNLSAKNPLLMDIENKSRIIKEQQDHIRELQNRDVLTEDSQNIEALHNLGVIAFQKGKNELAAEFFLKALVVKPDYTEAHNNLGVVFYEQGRDEEAKACYEKALALKPDYAEAYCNLGTLLKNQGKIGEALNLFTKAMELRPGYAEAEKNLEELKRKEKDQLLIRKRAGLGNLMTEKMDLINYACQHFNIKSFADLGGVWGVDGGYTFYALEKYKIDRAYLVDTDFTRFVEAQQPLFPQLRLLKANFGSDSVAETIAGVDAVFLFDVLLHQVAPDWDEIINKLSKKIKYFIVYNQQYLGPNTIRLLDLGEEEYFKNVPHRREEEPYKSLLEKMYQIHPSHNRIYRDIHNVWQWGITDIDLIEAMNKHGFEKVYYRNFGEWGGLKNFEGHSFIFKRIDEDARIKQTIDSPVREKFRLEGKTGESADSLIQIAQKHLQAGQVDNAEAIYHEVLIRDAKNFNSMHDLGLISFQKGKNELASEFFLKALAIKPDDAVAHNNLGFIFNELGRREEARVCYEMAIALKPDYAEALKNLEELKKKTEPDRGNFPGLSVSQSSEVQDPQVNKKLAFIDLAFHQRTKSTLELIEIFKRYFTVDVYWDDGTIDFTNIATQNYDTVIFFQQIYGIRKLIALNVKNIVIIPMYDDALEFSDSYLKQFSHVKFINFSKIFHHRFLQLGLNSKLVQYYISPSTLPDPAPHFNDLSGFFWQRTNHIRWSTIKKLIQGTHFEKFHLHCAVDNPKTISLEKPSGDDLKKFGITMTNWFSNKEEYLSILNASNIFFAPRLNEGIGMSFLEAMAMGKCVVAPDNPTMNEYIKHGENGLLYDPENPVPLDFSKAEEMGKNARKYAEEGYRQWKQDEKEMIQFILGNESDGKNDLQKRVVQDQSAVESITAKVCTFPFWYHKIELPGGVVTPGWAPLNPASYGIPERLDGKRVLDVGAWDGYWTFEALKRGAREVVAIDDFSDFLGSLENSSRRAWETFDLCREALGYSEKICKRFDLSVYDITEEQFGRFDFVFFFGTLYHLRHPLVALDRLSAVCDGEIYAESAILDDFSPYRGGLNQGYKGQMVMEFYPGKEYGNNNTNWWVPTLLCFEKIVAAAGFTQTRAWKLDESPKTLPYCRGFVHGKKAV